MRSSIQPQAMSQSISQLRGIIHHRFRQSRKLTASQESTLNGTDFEVVSVMDDISEDLQFDTIDSALNEIAAGRFVVVLDDAHRENEGDLVAAAELVTTESIAFMVEHTSGVICVGMEGADLDRLKLPLMVPPSENTDAKCTAFTITVDLRNGTTTGISASDRAKTLRALANTDTDPTELRRPGHIFPLRYEEGGVLRRRGHTEASVDLARLAGCRPAGVLCEIVNRRDGSMARTPQLFKFAKLHGLKIITIEDLVNYRQSHEALPQEQEF